MEEGVNVDTPEISLLPISSSQIQVEEDMNCTMSEVVQLRPCNETIVTSPDSADNVIVMNYEDSTGVNTYGQLIPVPISYPPIMAPQEESCTLSEVVQLGPCNETIVAAPNSADNVIVMNYEDSTGVNTYGQLVSMPISYPPIMPAQEESCTMSDVVQRGPCNETIVTSPNSADNVIVINYEDSTGVNTYGQLIPMPISYPAVMPEQDEVALNEHQHIHEADDPYSSHVDSETNMRLYQGTLSGGRPLECDICGKSFTTESGVKVHRSTHSGERPFSCDVCDKSFKQPRHLRAHQRTHNIERPFSCDVCNKSFKQLAYLKIHLHTHGKRPFCCDVCNKSFTCQSILNAHQRIHSEESPFKCDLCNKSLEHRSRLEEHLRMHTWERPFICDKCNKTFTYERSLKAHQRKYRGECLFKCDICNRSFTGESKWKEHQHTHNGERPFSCDMCNRTFTLERILKKHQRTHSVERLRRLHSKFI